MHFDVIVQSKNRAIIIIQRVQIQYQTIGSKVRFRNFKKKKNTKGDKKSCHFSRTRSIFVHQREKPLRSKHPRKLRGSIKLTLDVYARPPSNPLKFIFTTIHTWVARVLKTTPPRTPFRSHTEGRIAGVCIPAI